LIRFFVFLSLTALILGGAVWIGHGQGFFSMPSFFYPTLLFLLLGTAIIYRYLIKVEKPEFFVQLYLITMAMKLLTYGAYCWVMIAQDNAGAPANVGFFLAVYLAFTVLEIGFLFHKISAKNTR
jgi:hypothetical protein